MYNNSLVSVILPVYNSERYLDQTIQSILKQTYSNIEVLAVNDCSTDSSLDILKNYANIDDRITIFNLDKNNGVAYARNYAINRSQGRYLAFIDSDDIWLESKIEDQLYDLEKNTMYFSFTAIEVIDQYGNLVKKGKKIKRIVNYKYLLKNTIIATSSVIVDKSHFIKVEMPNLRSGQDYATWLKILRSGDNALGLNKPLVKYRLTPNSLSKNKFKSILQVWGIQKEYENINFFTRTINIIFFIFYAIKKKYF